MENSFECPISHQEMVDPVCDKEGNTFERSNIVKWLQEHGTSPITRTPMTVDDLVPNRALKQMIQSRHNIAVAPVAPVPHDAIKVEIEMTSAAIMVDDVHRCLISIKPKDSKSRPPVDISCVIDVSGSMGSEATFANAKGKKESQGLTILDIVKHAVKTVIKSLDQNDRLGIISFSDTAQVCLELTEMNQTGQQVAIAALTSLETLASTNLWAGLEQGMDQLRDSQKTLSAVFLFTDGVPNIEPPRGHIPMLNLYKDKHNTIPSISTFGFGYELDSSLLNEIAIIGKGQYAFIPDSSFVGTIFVHSIANLLSTAATNAQLSIETLNGYVVDKVWGHTHPPSSWGVTIDLGSLAFGQSKDIIIDFKNINIIKQLGIATLKAKTLDNPQFSMSIEPQALVPSDDIKPNHLRLFAVETIKEAISTIGKADDPMRATEAKSKIGLLLSTLKRSEPQASTLALLHDVQDQVSQAFVVKYYKKWGRHYLPSLTYAHLNQVCNNFKDKGPQVYGGELFRSLRDAADSLFCNLDPPVPTLRHGTTSAAPINMSAFNNSANVCFHPDCKVILGNGLLKPVSAVSKGDVVECMNGPGIIECVIKTKAGSCEFIRVPDGPLVTPWHPIYYKDQYTFPHSIGKLERFSCDFVYNFVVDSRDSIKVDGVSCVTLGHGLQGPVCFHEYFGGPVIGDLQHMNGWDQGLIFIGGVLRSDKTGLITGLIESNSIEE